MRALGVRIDDRDTGTLRVYGVGYAAFASGAPFVAAAPLLPESELVIRGVNLNPRRTGLLTILERMGASIDMSGVREVGGEPAGDLLVKHAPLVATDVGPEEVPAAIDELPLFALAAAPARELSEQLASPRRRRSRGS